MTLSRAINLVTRFSYISALPEQEHGGKMKIPGKEVVKPACNCVNQNVPEIGKLRRGWVGGKFNIGFKFCARKKATDHKKKTNKQTDVRFSCICVFIDREFLQNIAKETVDLKGFTRVDPQKTLTKL